ncbi:MAG: VanZ family protein [Desulfurivibrionaceae bacterium]
MILRLLPVLIVMAFIFSLSHLPGDSLDSNYPEGSDKVYHAVIYGLLALSCIYAVRSGSDNRKPPLIKGLAIVIFCIIYGITDEYHQSFITGRSADWRDLTADTFGAFLMVLGWWHWLYHRVRKGSMKNLNRTRN